MTRAKARKCLLSIADKMETFDDIVAKYEQDPVAFIEGIWRGMFEYPVADDPYCLACRRWGELTGRPILLTSKEHVSENIGDNFYAWRATGAHEAASEGELFVRRSGV